MFGRAIVSSTLIEGWIPDCGAPIVSRDDRGHREQTAGRWRTWTILLLAFAAYSALTVLLTFPLVVHVRSRLPKDLGDPLLATSILWWNAHVMPLTERWWNGFGFYPAPGMMSFSSHFLGASLIAAPLQWIGSSAITAYNVTFLMSFPLCAVAAHALALTITKRHDAAIVCGLAYGFNPYRVGHLEHLELLMGFGMPAALAALHLYADTRRARWLAALVAALVIQALCTSYYILFFTVFVGLWILWFMPPREWRATLAVLGACLLSMLVIAPLIAGYSHFHQSYNWRRDLPEEIARFSADLTSLVTASRLSAVWGWTASLNGSERQLFPGLTITALGLLGIVFLIRARTTARDRPVMLSRICWLLSAVFIAIAAGTRIGGPWRVDVGWWTISAIGIYKPLSLAAAFATIAIGSGTTLRAAFRDRSALAFYLIAAAIFFLCSLGPKPTFLGQQILYEPPYAWLMRLPFFGDTVRVPARFGMLGILALAIAGSLAFDRLRSMRPQRVGLLLAVVCVGIVADGSIAGLTLPAPPTRAFSIPPGDDAAAVLELPLGDVFRDVEAMYRSTLHGKRVINGYNGFGPAYYEALQRALGDRDDTALNALASLGPLVIAAENAADRDGSWPSFVANHGGIKRLSVAGDWTLFRLPKKRPPAAADGCAPHPLEVAAVFDKHGRVATAVVTDQNPGTRWITSRPQREGDVLIIDLGGPQTVCGVTVSMGSAAVLYPGVLSAATSLDNIAWETGFAGNMGGPAVLAALQDPWRSPVFVPLSGKPARFIRLRVERSHARYPWAVADIVVNGQPASPDDRKY